jgi:HK97 family phage prohead protease
MEALYRAFTPDLEIRSASKGGDGRTIYGLAVPYNYPQRIDDSLTEEFMRGAFDHQLRAAHRVPFTRGHMSQGGTLIGRAMDLSDDAAGLVGTWRVSNTPAGEETLELVRDGVLSQLSIGFYDRASRRTPAGVVQRVKADLTEVAIVLNGAYGEGALVAGVRSAVTQDRMSEAKRILNSLPAHLPLP